MLKPYRAIFLYLLTGLLAGNGQLAQAQCNLSGLSPTYCINSNSSSLTANFSGGLLSGQGIVNSVFQPSLAGIGTHTISYSYCSSTYSLEAETFTQIPYVPIYITLGDNQMSTQLPIGFTFRFFCNDYTSFYISSNGFITFSPQQPDGCCQGLPLPNSTGPTNIIACAWTDLDPSQGGTIRYSLLGNAPNRFLLVSFNCVFHKTGQGPVTSEIILYESSNNIEISTVTIPQASGPIQYNTTMGIQSASGQALAVPGRNGTSNWTATNELYRFTPGPDCSITLTTSVYSNPTVTASSSRTYICKGETTLLNAGGSSNYIWNTSQTGQSISVSPTIATTYTVTGMNPTGCSGTGTILVKASGCSGIEEQEMLPAFAINVYPNPGNGEFIIQSAEDLNLSLKNEFGQNVKSFDLSGQNNHKVSITNLSPGVFILVDEKSNSGISKKIVVLNN